MNKVQITDKSLYIEKHPITENVKINNIINLIFIKLI